MKIVKTEKSAKNILNSCNIMNRSITEHRINWNINSEDEVILKGRFTLDELHALLFLIGSRKIRYRNKS